MTSPDQSAERNFRQQNGTSGDLGHSSAGSRPDGRLEKERLMIALLFLGILAAWLCWRLVYARYWKKDLSVRAEFADGWVYEGDTSCLLEEITNDKILPVPALEVRLAMSRNLEFASDAQANTSVTDQSYKRDIFSLLTRQRILRRLPFVCRVMLYVGR